MIVFPILLLWLTDLVFEQPEGKWPIVFEYLDTCKNQMENTVLILILFNNMIQGLISRDSQVHILSCNLKRIKHQGLANGLIA